MEEEIIIEGVPVTGKLGEGMYASVYEWEGLAVKIIGENINFEKCISELDIMTRASHENVLSAIRIVINDRINIFMKKGDMNLSQLIFDKDIDIDVKDDLTIGICKGLHYLHSMHIIHNDLKLDNIIIFSEGDRFIPKISDFSLSRYHKNESSAVYSPNYKFLPPEYLAGYLEDDLPDITDTIDLWPLLNIVYTIYAKRILMACLPDNVQLRMLNVYWNMGILTDEQIAIYHKHFETLSGKEKWFVEHTYRPSLNTLDPIKGTLGEKIFDILFIGDPEKRGDINSVLEVLEVENVFEKKRRPFRSCFTRGGQELISDELQQIYSFCVNQELMPEQEGILSASFYLANRISCLNKLFPKIKDYNIRATLYDAIAFYLITNLISLFSQVEDLLSFCDIEIEEKEFMKMVKIVMKKLHFNIFYPTIDFEDPTITDVEAIESMIR